MKHIHNYIDKRRETNSPDSFNYKDDRKYSYKSSYARAFIYNINTHDIIWSEPGEVHNDILFDASAKILKDFGLEEIMFVEEIYNSSIQKSIYCGRIWVIPNNVSKHRKFDVYIAWWNNLPEKNYNEYNENLIKSYNKHFKTNIESYMFIDNDGNFRLIADNTELKIVKGESERKEDLEILRAIHLASASEKRKYLRGYLKNRNEKNQIRLYNHTKSKTAAEYNHIKTIGDSLTTNINIKQHTMKSLLDFILEQQSITFGASNATVDNYGQCIILAGGPGSGKGFIQSKILCKFKVYDVDELKKQYLKLVKLGKIEDDYEYKLSDPEDVGKLHAVVKKHGWKNEQRRMFWNQRTMKDSHSSGLLPNILFDMVSGDINDVFEVATPAKAMGYNVTVIWVVCNKDTASIGNKIRERRVNDKVIDTGHGEAYQTMSALFTNKYPEVTPLIDRAWIGFSAGYGRKLDKEYAASPVVRIKTPKDDSFNYNKSVIDKFLNEKQPIDYAFIEKQLNSKDEDKRATAERWKKIVGNEYQPNNVEESTEDTEEMIINAWNAELVEIL